MNNRAAIALICLVLAACGQAPTSSNSAPQQTANSPAQVATPAAQFVSRAAMFETYQIQAAQIAQQSAQSATVRTYAAAALNEHQATLQQLNGAVQAAGMPAPSVSLDDNYNAYLDMLRHANPQSFDATYASQQTLASISASGLYNSFTSTAPDSPLKQWAQAQSQHVHDGVTAGRHLASAVTVP